MAIKNGSEVVFAYRLFVGEELMDETLSDQPMTYIHGNGYLVQGLERAMEGLNKGDKKEVIVQPEDGYGVVSEEKIVRIPRDRIPREAQLYEGLKVPATSPEGEPCMGTLTGMDDESVTIDFNHELAGKTLRFEVEVIKVTNS